MSTAARWALVAGVVVFATVIALLPLVGDSGDSGDSGNSGGSGHEAAPEEPAKAAELDEARQHAGLRPCPDGHGLGEQRDDAHAATPESLDGVESICQSDGQPIDVGAALAGETTLVNVWATWCEPCLDELPVLEEYAHEQDAVTVLGVQVESDPVDGLEMLAELNVGLPSLHDGSQAGGPVAEALGLPPALPASYLVTAEGDVEFISDPRVFHSVEEVRAAVGEFGGLQ